MCVFARRERDLTAFADGVLSRLRPAALVISGDLTDSKTAHRLGSAQYASEWQSYERARSELLKGAGLPPTHLLAVRGNHDTFDVPVRGSGNDLFASHCAPKGTCDARRAHALHLTHANLTLLALDASVSPGPRRPCNFAGAAGEALRRDVEHAVSGQPRGVASLVAFGHFPLSLLHGGAGLQRQLSQLRAVAYLCGHLHWRFGNRLHHWHPGFIAGDTRTAPLLELEAGDWKESRAWRLLALDDTLTPPALSFRDYVFDPTAPAPLMLLITSPPDARYHSRTVRDAFRTAVIRAMVVPPLGVLPRDLHVTASVMCGDVPLGDVALHRIAGASHLWTGAQTKSGSGSAFVLESLARRCPAAPLRLRVRASCSTVALCDAVDERVVQFTEGAAAPMGTTRLAVVLMSMDGPRVAVSMLTCVMCAYAVLTVLTPVLFWKVASWNGRCSNALRHALLSPIAALAARPRLMAAHGAYQLYLCVGPWAAVDLFSGAAAASSASHSTTGQLYATGIRLPAHGGTGAYVAGMDAVFVTGPQMLFLTVPWSLLIMTLLAAADVAPPSEAPMARGVRCGVAALRRSAAARPGRALGAMAAAGLLFWANVAFLYELRESYGTTALVFSPGIAWVPLLALAALAAGLAAVPPQPKWARA